LTTALGNSYVADSATGEWRVGTLRGRPDDEERLVNRGIDRITFFTRDTAIATGYLSRSEGEPEILFRTIDAGRSWDTVSFGRAEWIYDVFATEHGDAWMGGSAGSFLHSRDFGATWEARSSPFDGSLRTHAIWMVDTLRGFVGALENAIKRTADGGRTWSSIPTPRDQEAYAGRSQTSDDRILKIAVFGGRLLVNQDGRIFESRVDRIAWKPLPDIVDFEVDRGRNLLFGVNKQLFVVELDSALRSTVLSSRALASAPLDLAAVHGTVYAIDAQYGVYEIDREQFLFSYPRARSAVTPLMEIVRRKGERLWGVASHNVWISDDGGASWSIVGETPFVARGLVPSTDHEAILWDGHGRNVMLDAKTGRTSDIVDFHGDDVASIVQRPRLWVAYGGKQYETTFRVEVSRSYFAGQFAGTRDAGFVYISRDDGASWRRVDTWAESGVAAAFVAPDDDIYLLSYLGAIRKLTKGDCAWQGRTILRADSTTWHAVPYVEMPSVFYFPDDSTGYVVGETHQLGYRRFRTRDGGRTWRAISESDFPYVQLIPVGPSYVARSETVVSRLGRNGETTLFRLRKTPGQRNRIINDISPANDQSVLVEVGVDLWTERGRPNKTWTTIRVR